LISAKNLPKRITPLFLFLHRVLYLSGNDQPIYRNVFFGYNRLYIPEGPIPQEKRKPFILRRKEKKDGRRD